MSGKNWAREPLVHFLLAGAVLFVFFAWKGEPADPASRTIAVTQEDRARLALQWQATMQRPPTDAELDSLTQAWLREEVLYREALRLGLDRDDAVVRKRLANKMDFLATSIAETAEPSEATLKAWLAENPQNFAEDTRYSFDQIYFSDNSDAAAALPKLSSNSAGWQKLGDAISLPHQLERTSGKIVASRFGEAFLGHLRDMKQTDEWSAPLPSGFGWHLIRLRGRIAGKVPQLAHIRQRVENDWRAATLEVRREEAYQLLLDSYEVSAAK